MDPLLVVLIEAHPLRDEHTGQLLPGMDATLKAFWGLEDGTQLPGKVPSGEVLAILEQVKNRLIGQIALVPPDARGTGLEVVPGHVLKDLPKPH